MENEIIAEDATPEEIVSRIANLAMSQDESAISDLRRLLGLRFSGYGDHHLAVTRLASRALLQKGNLGVQVLSRSALDASFNKGELLDIGVILEALWHGSHGQLPPKGVLLDVDLISPLENPPSRAAIEAARESFHEIVEGEST